MGSCCNRKTWGQVLVTLILLHTLGLISLYAGCLLLSAKAIEIKQYKTNIYVQQFIDYIGSQKVTGLTYCSVLLNSIWFIACITILVNFCRREKERALYISYIIWNISGLVALLFDLVSMVIYILDFTNNDKEYGALYMALISSHGIILYIFDIMVIIFMIKSTKIQRRKVPLKPKRRTIPLKPPKPVLKIPNDKEFNLEEENVERVLDWYKHYEKPEENENNNNSFNFPQFFPRVSSISKTNEEPISPSYVNGIHHNPTVPGVPGSNTNIMVNGVPSGTLRRQLPWRYFGKSNLPPRPPPKPVRPHVPAPDYDLKYPKPVTRRDFNEPGWNQYL